MQTGFASTRSPDPLAAEIRDTDAWVLTLDPRERVKEGVDFDWVGEYAIKAFEETAEATNAVDEKAIKFIGFTSATAALVAAVATKATLHPVPLWLLFAAVVIAAASATFAFVVVRPTTQYTLPSIRTAYDCADYFGKGGRAVFAAKLHQSRLRQCRVLNRKSAWLKWAFGGASLALWMSLVAFALETWLRG